MTRREWAWTIVVGIALSAISALLIWSGHRWDVIILDPSFRGASEVAVAKQMNAWLLAAFLPVCAALTLAFGLLAALANLPARWCGPRAVMLIVPTALILLISGVVFKGARADRAPRLDVAFAQLVKNGDPIVRALEQFRKKSNRYPHSLSELVPKYLPDVPSPGAPMFSAFVFIGSPQGGVADAAFEPFRLLVWCRGINQSGLAEYWPASRGPYQRIGRMLAREGDWVLLNE